MGLMPREMQLCGKGQDSGLFQRRSKGDSVSATKDFATKHGYNVIWTSGYYGRTYGSNGYEGEACAQLPNGTDLNGIFAENMETLIKNLLS